MALLTVALVLALWPAPSSVPGLPDYPFFDSRAWSLVITAALVLSASEFVISSLSLFRRPFLVAGWSGLGAFLAGGVWFSVTLIYPVEVRTLGGATVFYQLYPQSVLPVEWGITVTLLLGAFWILPKDRFWPRRPSRAPETTATSK